MPRPLRWVLISALAAALLIPCTAAGTDPKREFFKLDFKAINEKGYPVLEMTNETGKAVDDLSGGFVIEDPEGNYLFSTGQTEAVPGVQFLGAGESREMVPFGLKRREALMEQLRTDPSGLRFYFEARSITYMDGSKESSLGG